MEYLLVYIPWASWPQLISYLLLCPDWDLPTFFFLWQIEFFSYLYIYFPPWNFSHSVFFFYLQCCVHLLPIHLNSVQMTCFSLGFLLFISPHLTVFWAALCMPLVTSCCNYYVLSLRLAYNLLDFNIYVFFSVPKPYAMHAFKYFY